MGICANNYLFHVGNAGVILKLGDTIVGIDVFIGTDISPYESVPVKLEKDLLYHTRYADLDLLVITHNHKDHFDIEKVITYLQVHTSTLVLAGRDVAQLLKEAGINCHRFLIKEELPNGDYHCRCGELDVEYLLTAHMGKAYRGTQHYSVLIRYHGQVIFISGDAAPDEELYIHLKEYCRDICILIVPFPVLGLSSARKIMLQYFKPKQIFLVHFPEAGQDTENWIQSTVQSCEKAGDDLPIPVYCIGAGDVYSLLLNDVSR